MPAPQFHEIFRPHLRRSDDGREWTLAALRGTIADDSGLSMTERAELLPSGTQSRFVNRLCWAKIHLKRAGLVTRVRRGAFTISDAGRTILTENPAAIDVSFLDRHEPHREFRHRRVADDGPDPVPGPRSYAAAASEINESSRALLHHESQ